MSSSHEALVDMGFPEERVSLALSRTGGDIDAALTWLLASPGDDTPSAEVVTGTLSQYSLEEGRSACSAISVVGAAEFLAANPTIDGSWLDNMVLTGYALYQQVSGGSPVDHMSPEEVLPHVPQLELVGGIRQGLTMGGFTDVLRDCVPPSGWCCAVITKSPETIWIALSATGECWLVDSHPRPPLYEHAYAKKHASLEELCTQSLQPLFPPVELGPGVPEMMAMMYNSFDVYCVRLRS